MIKLIAFDLDGTLLGPDLKCSPRVKAAIARAQGMGRVVTLATGRADIARQMLLACSEVVESGMLPNNFPDAGGDPQYNSIDAALWFFEAVRQFFAATKDGRTLL